MIFDAGLIFSENITFLDYVKSGVVYYTDNLDELYFLKNKGWKYSSCSKGFRVNPPACVICDISDCNKIYEYQNVIFNFAYYLFLKNLIKNSKLNNFIDFIISKNFIKYKDFKYHILCSPIVETEVKIEGSDKRIFDLKIDLCMEFIKSKDYPEIFNYAFKKIKSYKLLNKKTFNNNNLSKNFQNFYNDLSNKTSLVKNGFTPLKNFYEIDDKILDHVNYDILLFMPSGCYKFLQLFVNEKNYDKVMFWDFHLDKMKNTTYKLYDKNIKNKKVLIIDSIYSGKTLEIAKRYVKKSGGIPITLGVFPKSKYSIKPLDYALIINKVYQVSDLHVNSDTFFEDIYVSSFKGEL